MRDYSEKIVPNVSDTWRADEIYVKVKGDMKYLFAVMDDETRFLIAQEVAENKDKHDARKLFVEAKRLMKRQPKELSQMDCQLIRLRQCENFQTLLTFAK